MAARRAWVAVMVVLVGLVSIVVASGGLGRPGVVSRPAGRDAAGLARLQGLPLQAQSVISTTVGAGAPVFAARRSGDGYRAWGGGVSGRFDRAGAVFVAGARSLSFGSLAIGRDGRFDRLGRFSVAAEHGRVVYQSRGVSEWYAAGPLGIEQGFTLTHRPAGGGRLTVAVGFAGGLRARLSGSSVQFLNRSGRLALRYGGLSATDARGRNLPATLTVHHGQLLISVTDSGARYPLRIDPLVQRGSKLTGGSETGAGFFGYSVALSANGSTALIGGYSDNSYVGAAWVFTNSGGTWTQQGSKLTGSSETGQGWFGYSVALSGDGNTALIGGIGDNNSVGAAWVFTRSGATWAQQGSKLTGSGETGKGFFGQSVALSSDGTTALIGGAGDNSAAGAAWVFTNSGGTWTQQGSKLTANNETLGSAAFGDSVALSSDGSTALIGGFSDNNEVGAAWVFTRSGSTWTQGPKLTANDETGVGEFGSSVALSSDGSTALIGGDFDNNSVGAAWVFTNSGGNWTQQGAKLTANDETGPSGFGISVALSSDGNIALIGGFSDNNFVGAAWVFTRSGSTWTQQGSKLTASDETGAAHFGYSVALSTNGSTALIGGYLDNHSVGAAWLFAGKRPDVVVNSTGDAALKSGASSCDTGNTVVVDSSTVPECTLRAAIEYVNSQAPGSTISFDIPGGGVPVIAPMSALPKVTASMTIDGSTQPGGWVQLSGASVPAANGLELDGDGDIVRGLVIDGFSDGYGILLAKGGGDTIAGNRIGTNVAGTSADPNKNGVEVQVSNVTIGGTTGTSTDSCSGDCNLISGNSGDDVGSSTGGFDYVEGVRIVGDWVGINAAGNAILPGSSTKTGIGLSSSPRETSDGYVEGGTPSTVGGITARPGMAPGDVIATPGTAVGVNQYGREDGDHAAIYGPPLLVEGDLIGLDASGQAAAGSRSEMVTGVDSRNSEVGGLVPGAGNVIGGFQTGVHSAFSLVGENLIGTNLEGNAAVPNTIGVKGWVTLVDNVISGNTTGLDGQYGDWLIRGNLIGLARDGHSPLPNNVGITGSYVQLGNTPDEYAALACQADPCNVVSGNREAGIRIESGGLVASYGTYFGTDISGTSAIPNGAAIQLKDTLGPSERSTWDKTVDGYINLFNILWHDTWYSLTGEGRDKAPLIPIPPQASGESYLRIGGASDALRTGRCEFPCNLIAGNRGAGVVVDLLSSSGLVGWIQGNVFGLGADGKPMPNGGPDLTITGTPDGPEMPVGGNEANGNIFAGDSGPLVDLPDRGDHQTPRIALITNRYELTGTGALLKRPLKPGAPILKDAKREGSTVRLSGSIETPSLTGPGEDVEVYASAECQDGIYDPVGLFHVHSASGEFNVDVHETALGGAHYLTALLTTEEHLTSRFSRCVEITR